MRRLVFLFFFLLGIAIAATVAGIVVAGSGRLGEGPTILVWRLSGAVPEQRRPRLPFSGAPEPVSLAELYPAFRAARRDPAVRGLAVYIQDADLGLARAQELRRQMMALRRAGKFVDCYLEAAGEGANGTLPYYLATACGSIALAPAADLNLLGLYAESRFWRGTLDKLKIDPDFHRVGRYKSAVEAYTQGEYSPEAQEAMAAVLDGDFAQIVAAVSEARHKSEAEVRALIDGAPWTAEEALARGLVDRLAYPDEMKGLLEKKAGGRADWVAIEDYEPRPALSGPHVAVVFALGEIVRGEGGAAPWTGESYVGSDDLARVLRQVGRDGSIKAVVLRVDSPGGSALASDLILREIDRLRAKKPVVVSMSDTAASGGYYIAAKADRIVAEPGTLTGAIGIFGGKFVTRRFEEETLGIGHDVQKRGANADLYSSLQPYTLQQGVRVQQLMDHACRTSVGRVAAGRRMTRSAVEGVAAGRVWTGAAAQRLGLVDELGGLDRAVEIARARAHVGTGETVSLDFYPSPPSWLDLFLETREPKLPTALAAVVKTLETTPPRLLELPPEVARLARPF